jgi:hypothetical protein
MAGPRPNRFTASQIKSRLLHNAQTSVYQVKLQPPDVVVAFLNGRGFSYPAEGTDVELRCETASLPGSSLSTHSQENDYHGVSEKMAYRRMYDSTTDFTFYVGRNYGVIEMFEGWIEYITGMIEPMNSYRNEYNFHRMSYPLGPTGYQSPIFISKFEKDSNETYLEYEFVRAFPLNIIATPISYGPSDTLRCTVSMSYVRYVKERRGRGGLSTDLGAEAIGRAAANGFNFGDDTDLSSSGAEAIGRAALSNNNAFRFEGSIGDLYTGPGDPNLPIGPGSPAFERPFVS